MSRIAEIIFHKSPLLWSPSELDEVVEFFREHRTALALFRRDSIVRKRVATRNMNSRKRQSSKHTGAKKPTLKKKKKTKLDSIDIEELLLANKAAKGGEA